MKGQEVNSTLKKGQKQDIRNRRKENEWWEENGKLQRTDKKAGQYDLYTHALNFCSQLMNKNEIFLEIC